MTDGRRVLQLLGPSTGGIRRHVAFLVSSLEARGWTVRTAGPAGVLDDVGQLDHAVPIGGTSPAHLARARRALRSLLDGVDIVHAHGLQAGWVAAVARGRRRRPAIVLTVHNVVLDETHGRAAPLLRWLQRRLPRRVDAVIAVSPDMAIHVGADVTVIGPQGARPAPQRPVLDVRRVHGVAADDPLAVVVARLHRQKALDVVIAAMPSVVGRVPEARLLIVGEGPLETELRATATRSPASAHITFAAPMHPADELAAADVVVIPSLWESGPLVLAEAVALGRPVVATPVGTVPELITDGESGWIVPIGDPAALAGALAEALTDKAEAGRRAAVAAERLRSWDRRDRVGMIETVYRDALANR